MFLRPSFLLAIVAFVLEFSTNIDAVQFTDGGGRQLKGSCDPFDRRLNGKQRRAKSSGDGDCDCEIALLLTGLALLCVTYQNPNSSFNGFCAWFVPIIVGI